MTDITINDAFGATLETLNSKHRTTVGDLLDMIGAGVLRKDGVLMASKSYVLEPGTYMFVPSKQALEDDQRKRPGRPAKNLSCSDTSLLFSGGSPPASVGLFRWSSGVDTVCAIEH